MVVVCRRSGSEGTTAKGLIRARNSERAPLHAEFAVDVREIPLHRGDREKEPVGDFTVVESICKQHFRITPKCLYANTRFKPYYLVS
jgi:hypothetical protein